MRKVPQIFLLFPIVYRYTGQDESYHDMDEWSPELFREDRCRFVFLSKEEAEKEAILVHARWLLSSDYVNFFFDIHMFVHGDVGDDAATELRLVASELIDVLQEGSLIDSIQSDYCDDLFDELKSLLKSDHAKTVASVLAKHFWSFFFEIVEIEEEKWGEQSLTQIHEVASLQTQRDNLLAEIALLKEQKSLMDRLW